MPFCFVLFACVCCCCCFVFCGETRPYYAWLSLEPQTCTTSPALAEDCAKAHTTIPLQQVGYQSLYLTIKLGANHVGVHLLHLLLFFSAGTKSYFGAWLASHLRPPPPHPSPPPPLHSSPRFRFLSSKTVDPLPRIPP